MTLIALILKLIIQKMLITLIYFRMAADFVIKDFSGFATVHTLIVFIMEKQN